MKKDKEYTEKEAAQALIKSVYKGILKNLKNRPYQDEAKAVVRDILDPNNVAQVDPDKIPSKKTNIMNKAKDAKKGVEKLKNFQKKKIEKKEGRCWEGYEPTPGKKAYTEGSCRKKS